MPGFCFPPGFLFFGGAPRFFGVEPARVWFASENLSAAMTSL